MYICRILLIELPGCHIEISACLIRVCHSGSALVSISEVNLRRARLVLGWVTASGFNSRCGTFISVCNRGQTEPVWKWLSKNHEQRDYYQHQQQQLATCVYYAKGK